MELVLQTVPSRPYKSNKTRKRQFLHKVFVHDFGAPMTPLPTSRVMDFLLNIFKDLDGIANNQPNLLTFCAKPWYAPNPGSEEIWVTFQDQGLDSKFKNAFAMQRLKSSEAAGLLEGPKP